MAICGRGASVYINTNIEDNAYNWEVTMDSDEQNVSTFGSGDYGDRIVCFKNGTIILKLRELAFGITQGTICDLICNTSKNNITANNAVCKTWTTGADALGLVEFSYTFIITGSVNIA